MYENQIVEEHMDFFVVGNITPTSIFNTDEDWRISITDPCINN